MATLLLRLQAPMQSWGTTSQFDERDTQLEPSKSGVIGMICAALGRDRSAAVDDLSSMKMGVRVDAEGVLMRDFQTAQGVAKANSKIDKERIVLSIRYYLADASFLVGFESHNSILLEEIQQALLKPVWPLCLGRKGFFPSSPIYLKDGLKMTSLKQSLEEYPLLIENNKNKNDDGLRRLILESEHEGSMRFDQPIAPFSERCFSHRYVSSEMIEISTLQTHLGDENVSMQD